jgi:hypothetical protein
MMERFEWEQQVYSLRHRPTISTMSLTSAPFINPLANTNTQQTRLPFIPGPVSPAPHSRCTRPRRRAAGIGVEAPVGGLQDGDRGAAAHDAGGPAGEARCRKKGRVCVSSLRSLRSRTSPRGDPQAGACSV